MESVFRMGEPTVNAWLIVVLILAGLLVAAVLVVGMVYLILFIAQQLGGSTGGLRRLAEAYPTQPPVPGPALQRETVKVGAVVYKRCVTVGIADRGLYLSVWGKSALVPWAEFKAITSAKLYWQTVPMLTVGDPPIATLVIPVAVFDRIRSRLPADLRDWSS